MGQRRAAQAQDSPKRGKPPMACTGMEHWLGRQHPAAGLPPAGSTTGRGSPRADALPPANDAPGCPAPATIRSFSSSRQRRRRSTPVVISVQTPEPDLGSARTNAAKVASQGHGCQAALAGRMPFAEMHRHLGV